MEERDLRTTTHTHTHIYISAGDCERRGDQHSDGTETEEKGGTGQEGGSNTAQQDNLAYIQVHTQTRTRNSITGRNMRRHTHTHTRRHKDTHGETVGGKGWGAEGRQEQWRDRARENEKTRCSLRRRLGGGRRLSTRLSAQPQHRSGAQQAPACACTSPACPRGRRGRQSLDMMLL